MCATSAQHVTKITEAGFNTKQSSIYIYLCDCSAINWTSLSTAPWANIVWVCNNSALDTVAPLMHPELALRALDCVGRSNTVPTDSTLKCFMLTLSPLFSMPSFHALSFDTHSSRVSAITARSSAYRSSHGTPVQNSCDSASSTNMKRTDPSTPTPNSSLYCWCTLRLKCYCHPGSDRLLK